MRTACARFDSSTEENRYQSPWASGGKTALLRSLEIVLLIFLLGVQNASAAGESGMVTIARMASASNLGNQIYIRASSTPTTPAACSQNTDWHLTVSLDTAWGTNIYAMLLAAKE